MATDSLARRTCHFSVAMDFTQQMPRAADINSRQPEQVEIKP
jgi:hypothetical protein